MAKYTWEDFEKAVKDAGYEGKFSDADLKSAMSDPDWGMSMLKSKQDWANATTDDQRALAHASAEKLRKSLGYTGGGDGGSFSLLDNSPGGYEGGSYESPYAQQIEELLKSVQSHSSEYDPTTDPRYSSYKKQYAREGARATEDTMGTLAAMTGGMPSTAAVTAASQAGDYYAAQMADKIPELYQQSYDDKLTQLQLLLGMDDTAYSRFASDREFDYGKWLDEYNSQQSEDSTKWDRAFDAAQLGDYSLLKALGLDVSGLESGGGYVTGSGSDSGTQGDSGAEGAKSAGMSDSVVNSLWLSYPNGEIPAGVWAQYAALYGESALTAAGFSKGNDNQTIINPKNPGETIGKQ